ncbi:hypothetical protein [Leptolyngbya sp. FACHB-261]|uniref:hypothetical protein n=1 Tax=Leptolyngbya sp. FACHB-261 TaxID=2692806 RepID=UPI0016826F3E|nr:hypothetical protein [Leptolyngbya sp. FACHB-261]MBD2105200.1 hypothetical protein [Leptolyngbya sp. FACHB-261]
MRIYLTHCSKEKEPNLKGTDIAVTPDKLYTNPGIQQFMERCKEKGVNWGILSDLYGVYLPDEHHVWYEKHPDTVTPQEEKMVIQDFNDKLSSYDEILFLVRPEAFHSFYGNVLKKTLLADKISMFQNVDSIE